MDLSILKLHLEQFCIQEIGKSILILLIGDKINEKKLKKIGEEGVLAMICDSTNVFSPGRAGSEFDVRKSLLNSNGN